MLGSIHSDPAETLPGFKSSFITGFERLRETEVSKSIEDGLSSACEAMSNFLEQPARANKTSVDMRKNLRSQGGNRIFRMTTGFKKEGHEEQPIEEEA
jgi:hypothetical protein